MTTMKLRANALIGGTLIAIVLVVASIAAMWTPYDPLGIDMMSKLKSPSAAHWLGTDEFGRDVLSRAMAGAAGSGSIALFTVVGAVVLGTIAGVLAGFVRGWTDRVLMAVNDALLAFPGILLALAVMVVVGASRLGLVIALTLAYAPSVVRVVRGTVLSLREKEYVEA